MASPMDLKLKPEKHWLANQLIKTLPEERLKINGH
jgi:hypothetical protein